jgi:hypothetical protein
MNKRAVGAQTNMRSKALETRRIEQVNIIGGVGWHKRADEVQGAKFTHLAVQPGDRNFIGIEATRYAVYAQWATDSTGPDRQMCHQTASSLENAKERVCASLGEARSRR